MNFFYPTDVFPFTDEPETDGGITDAILARAEKRRRGAEDFLHQRLV